ncbi:MAG: type II/IV secretion system protein [SAR324 cluster bacterium]|nr:type II/IV secretion system protein [SAR324 cluster bacterium]
MFNQEFFNYLSDNKLIDLVLVKEELSDNGQKDQTLKQFLLSRRYMTEASYQESLANFLGLKFMESPADPDEKVRDLFIECVPHRIAYKYLFFPVEKSGAVVNFAIADTKGIPFCEEAADLMGRTANIIFTMESNILNLIQKEYNTDEAEKLEDDDAKSQETVVGGEGEDLLASDDDEPIRRLVNSMLFHAMRYNASDVHIDPTATQTIVRNRMDGILRQINEIPKHAHNKIVNRVKVMAKLDIATRNVPQDGRTMIKLAGKKLDIRVSIIPTIHGERVVLRLLQQSHGLLGLTEIDLQDKIKKLLIDTVSAPNGIMLVTGPTGSGKTTTLYSCLQSIDHNSRNVITVEDPVEYQMSGYGQVQVNEKQGLTFAAGLRSILRQDPDVIMVGEIRDTETAQIAIQSALTGHLVLSTLHTNDALSTIIRLIDMGVEPFLISSTLKCVLSQRLVRRFCQHCRVKVKKSWKELSKIGFTENTKEYFKGYIYEHKGCDECSNSGYAGRLGVHEILVVNDVMRSAISQNSSSMELREAAIKSDALIDLATDCHIKVLLGYTSVVEVNRLLFELQQSQETVIEQSESA